MNTNTIDLQKKSIKSITIGDLKSILSTFPDDLTVNFGHGNLNISAITEYNDSVSVKFKEAFVVIGEEDDL